MHPNLTKYDFKIKTPKAVRIRINNLEEKDICMMTIAAIKIVA
jgi:hypothetical protein